MTTSTDRSEKLFSQAQQWIPGGVNSPVRAFGAVGGTPRFLASASGCYVTDVDGNRYIDYVGSWGPMILGHSHPRVVEAVKTAAAEGTSFGAPCEGEVRLAEQICRLVPSVEKVRLVNSGTEATMSALRLARAYTRRPMVIKFDGCYHGHADSFLVQAGSGVATFGLPNTPGVPPEFTEQTLSLPFNDLNAVEEAFEKHASRIGAIICEPVSGNMGVIAPPVEFLQGLIDLAEHHGAVVIFDEVMTGFRLAAGGVQELFSLRPHLTCLGKVVGGGLPMGAFGGRRDIMSLTAPEGDVYQAGTLSGNPLAVAAGLKTLQLLQEDPPYDRLRSAGEQLTGGLREAAQRAGVEVTVQHCGSMFTVFFGEGPIREFADVKRCDAERFGRFFHGLLDRGIYLAPSQFEACFLSTQHTEKIIEETVSGAEEVFQELK